MPHALEQCYSFVYCLDTEVTPLRPERITAALTGFPWRGGFSYLNVYSVLKGEVLWADRPTTLLHTLVRGASSLNRSIDRRCDGHCVTKLHHYCPVKCQAPRRIASIGAG